MNDKEKDDALKYFLELLKNDPDYFSAIGLATEDINDLLIRIISEYLGNEGYCPECYTYNEIEAWSDGKCKGCGCKYWNDDTPTTSWRERNI